MKLHRVCLYRFIENFAIVWGRKSINRIVASDNLLHFQIHFSVYFFFILVTSTDYASWIIDFFLFLIFVNHLFHFSPLPNTPVQNYMKFKQKCSMMLASMDIRNLVGYPNTEKIAGCGTQEKNKRSNICARDRHVRPTHTLSLSLSLAVSVTHSICLSLIFSLATFKFHPFPLFLPVWLWVRVPTATFKMCRPWSASPIILSLFLSSPFPWSCSIHSP